MRPRPPYYMTSPERAVGDVNAMLLAIETNGEDGLVYPHFSQIQRVIRAKELALREGKDYGYLRDRRETDIARLARATRAHFDPTALIDHQSEPFDYRSVENYWEMTIRIAQNLKLNALSSEGLFRFAIRNRNGLIPEAVRRVLVFDKRIPKQFSR